jgi:hypothetical protein
VVSNTVEAWKITTFPLPDITTLPFMSRPTAIDLFRMVFSEVSIAASGAP